MTNAPAPPPTGQPGTVYLIHLERPYRHARHYLGWALDVNERLAAHRAGRGSPLLRAASAHGIAFDVVRSWPADRHFERRLKRWHKSSQLCPRCSAQTGTPATR